MQPPPYVAPQPPMAPPAQRPGHRGLWMALGAIAALAVIGLAAMQLPKFLKARAGAPAQQETAAPVSQAPSPAASPEPVSVTPAPEPPPASSAASEPRASRPAVSAAQPRGARDARRGAAAVSDSAPAASQQAFTPEPAAPAPQAAAPAQGPAVNEAALEEIRDRFVSIGSRANALGTALKNLENQQRAQGVGMRMDISTAWRRMEALLDDAEASLKGGNAERAKKNLDAAEREADKLDKFLGH